LFHKELFGLRLLFLEAHRIDGTEVHAGSAVDASFRVAYYAMLRQIESELGADCHASAASEAFRFVGYRNHKHHTFQAEADAICFIRWS
jgi:hypothetical protein